jgi:hypothetical protein
VETAAGTEEKMSDMENKNAGEEDSDDNIEHAGNGDECGQIKERMQ